MLRRQQSSILFSITDQTTFQWEKHSTQRRNTCIYIFVRKTKISSSFKFAFIPVLWDHIFTVGFMEVFFLHYQVSKTLKCKENAWLCVATDLCVSIDIITSIQKILKWKKKDVCFFFFKFLIVITRILSKTRIL